MFGVVLGSGLRPACTDWSAFGPMLISEMEAVLKSLDQRVGRIEQILPTLATKVELRDEIRGVRVLVEDLGEKIDTLGQHLSDQMDKMSDLLDRLNPGR